MTDPSPPVRPGTPPDPAAVGPAFRELCDVVAQLRSPEGCPWDRVQTLESLKPHTLEETYELLDAIDSGDNAAIAEELGDVLLQVILDAQIGADEGRFELLDVIVGVTEKLVRRHPHVFGDAVAENPSDVDRHWERIKRSEKKEERESILDGLPADLPQLARAARLSEKAARVGYDFPQRAMLFDKLREEIAELAQELFPGGAIPDVPASVEPEIVLDEPIVDPALQLRAEGEIGDILFVVANIARRWHINPEEALRKSNAKFARRFRKIEQALRAQNRSIRDASLQEMEAIYQAGKRDEGSGAGD